jgi:hypothetical protein
LTPDHSIFAKRVPVYLSENISDSIDKYASSYQSYFDQNVSSELTCLDPAPRWGIWPGCGIISFGLNPKNAAVISDIASHTTRVIQISEFLGGWVPLKEGDVFEVEYWELEQAKLKSGKSAPPLQGIIAHISLSESSMANQCKERLTKAGAAVITIEGGTKPNKARSIVEKTVLAHGGLDILITDIGVDSSSGAPEDILSGALPYLKLGINSKIIAIGDVSSSDLHQSHQKIMTYLADSAEKQIGVVVLNPDNGETVISANNSATVTGDPKIVEKITAA